MSYSKSVSALFVVLLCAAVPSADAGQHSGGRAPGHGSVTVGRAAPRTYGGAVPVHGGVGYRPYSYPYYRPGFSIGFGFGFGYPYYGYGYPYYGYGYPYYGYPYYGYPYYGYGYPYGYAYPAYGYAIPPDGYVSAAASGGVRIQGAPHDAQVFADGGYVGTVDDFDGALQQLNLPPGPHAIEIRIQGRQPMAYDVNVQAGHTVTIHSEAK